MVRRYDSRRRREAAENTRREILQAALRLHWEGVTEFAPLAEEAGCSVATVRRHFPTREDLFRDCTRTFAERLVLPDFEALAAIEDRGERLASAVNEACRVHEAMLGYAWLAERERDTSPTLAAELDNYTGLADAVAGLLFPVPSPAGRFARGMLDHLTYRALRLSGGLSPDEVRARIVSTLRLLDPAGDEHPGSPEPSQEPRP
jgi:AcrR family transcriptional regulator